MKVDVNVIGKLNVKFVLYVKYLRFIKTFKIPKLKRGKRKTQIFLCINIWNIFLLEKYFLKKIFNINRICKDLNYLFWFWK